MLLAAGCAIAIAAGAPAPNPGFEELPFAFRLEAVDTERYRNAVAAAAVAGPSIEWLLDGTAVDARIDVFDSVGNSWPRWRWRAAQTAKQGRAVFPGTGGVETLVVVRRPGRKDYQVDGPFRWPGESGHRTLREVRYRGIAGSDSIVSPGVTLSLVGQPPVSDDALCETDGASRWQCVAVPVSFKGVVATCGSRDGGAFGEVAPGSAAVVSFRHSAWASPIRLSPEEAVAEGPTQPEIRLAKPGPAGGQILVKEAGFEFLSLGGGLFWILGASPALDQTLQVRTGGHVARLPLSAALSGGACEPTIVALEAEERIFGTVYDKEGKAAPRPFVFVLEETESASGPDAVRTRVVSGVDGDDDGKYRFSELVNRTYIVRACQGSLGCSERRVVPGSDPVDFHIQPRGPFKGRIVSTSGVPEPGATVRLVPTLSTYAGAKDRFKYLPLETRADGEGRFQIAAPEVGKFLLEARRNETGTARKEVEVSELSLTETDLGDIRLPPLGEFSADVVGCAGGTLEFIGPVGGAATVPSTLTFPIEPSGRAIVGLPEGGMWLLSATCGSVRRVVDPAILYRAEELVGLHVRFNVVEAGPADAKPE